VVVGPGRVVDVREGAVAPGAVSGGRVCAGSPTAGNGGGRVVAATVVGTAVVGTGGAAVVTGVVVATAGAVPDAPVITVVVRRRTVVVVRRFTVVVTPRLRTVVAVLRLVVAVARATGRPGIITVGAWPALRIVRPATNAVGGIPPLADGDAVAEPTGRAINNPTSNPVSAVVGAATRPRRGLRGRRRGGGVTASTLRTTPETHGDGVVRRP
jgi:hypothetical protein